MESIAVTKPNMTVTRQESLSPFGLLTALFTEEIARRNSRSPGFYRAMPLAYLEESETEAPPAAPEIHIDLNIDLLLNRLLKEARENEKNEKKPQTPPERILERVVVRERELRTAYSETRRIVIETGGKKYAVNMPAKASAQMPGQTEKSGGDRTRVDREILRIGESSSPAAADAQRRADSPSKLLSAVRTAKPVDARTAAERKHADRTLPLASQMLSAPAAGGWMPQQREMHPGYPVRPAAKQTGGVPTGSILLPDVLRRRREEAIAQSETRRVTVDVPEDYGAFEDALEWSTDGIEQISETERILREVRRAVDKTLRRNTLRGDEASLRTGKRREHEETPIRSHSADLQKESDDLYARARTHAHGTAETEPAQKAGSVPVAHTHGYTAPTFPSEPERDAAHAAFAAPAENAAGYHASTDRETAATSEQVYKRPASPTEAAVREETVPFAAIPTGDETIRSPELIHREQAEAPEFPTAELQDTEAPAPHSPIRTKPEQAGQARPEAAIPAAIPSEGAEPEESAALIFPEEPKKKTERGTERTDAPGSQPAKRRDDVPTQSAKKPVAATPAAIPQEMPEEAVPAELTYREKPEERARQSEEIRETETHAPQSPVRTETAKAGQARPETAIPVVIPSADADAGESAVLTYREKPEEHARQIAEIRKTEAPAPQPPILTEKAKAGQTGPETAIPIAIPSADTDTEKSAGLTYREKPEESVRQIVKERETDAPAPQSTIRTETVRAGQSGSKTAIPAAIPSAGTDAEGSAELTYRAEPEKSARRGTERANLPDDASAARRDNVPTQITEKPKTATPAAIPQAFPETDTSAGPVYRENTEERIRQNAERRDAEAPAPQSPVREETEQAVQAIPSTDTETEEFAELTHREDPEQDARHGTKTTNAPRDASTEYSAEVRTQAAKPETAIPVVIPSADAETEESAVLTYREKAEERTPQRAERPEPEAPAPQTAFRAETEQAVQPETETAIRAAIPSAEPKTNIPAELTYREDAEKSEAQSALPQTDGTKRKRPSAQQLPVLLPQQEESNRAQQQIVMTHRAQKAAGQTIREIRVTSEHGLRQTDAAHSERRNAEQAEQGGQKAQDADRIALPVGEEIEPSGPPELFFATPSPAEQPPEDPMAARPAKPSPGDKANELPSWAKELMEKSGVSQADLRSAAHSWNAGSPNSRQVNWTSPAAIPQQSVPNGTTELSFKEPRETEQLPSRQPIGDAEIQRTADRVYKIIEERLRRELRRSGR